MGIKINSFGGPLVWLFRKYNSNFTSKVMLNYAAKSYDKSIREYIEKFLKSEETPIFGNVMLETINRCNGTCAFCTANRYDEKRAYKKMEESLFNKIITELKELQFAGNIYFNVNNEPFIDNRILQFVKHAKENVPNAKNIIITNGTLLNIDKVDSMIGVVDELIINNYSKRYKLSEQISEIFKKIRGGGTRYQKINIVINRRYSEEILATRAGKAPNKPKKNNRINNPCIYPYTDLVIFPDGEVGMCCNDCFEETHFGNVRDNSLVEVWNNEKFTDLRNKMRNGRDSYLFCKECDVVDAGGREKLIKEMD